jgi:3D-(3,5/4)-trihydroxycyclohexane-1,2-dione acylhydrolase (decyclizing)
MTDNRSKPSAAIVKQGRLERALALSRADGLTTAQEQGTFRGKVALTLSEALVLGLLRQGVKTYFTVFGHGSTEVGEVLRIYQEAGLVKVFGLHSEVEASHAASALRWICGEKSAVVTSIGPGALQALAAALVPASDGIGVWYLFGDETTEDEGFNLQQIPRHTQDLFLQMTSVLGRAYSLHTPQALPTALRRGQATVDHPFRPGPFFLLLPMNTQATWLPDFNMEELPCDRIPAVGAAEGDYDEAARLIASAERVVIKVGGGGRHARAELIDLLQRSGGVLVHTPIASGCIPYAHPQNMGVGGSKGSRCGNYAMEHADMLIAVGTRAVCQSDCSRTGYPLVKQVINVNADVDDAIHYNRTMALLGDIPRTLDRLNHALPASGPPRQAWLRACNSQKQAWQEFKSQHDKNPVIEDEYWAGPVLTQPAAILTATDWAKQHGAVCLFDAGDVQANGFQIVEDDAPGQSYTESGASYMGFAASALLASAASARPFYGLALTGDGSLLMNPQILIDGVEHGVRGCILLLDNSRMGAISSLQLAQYESEFATSTGVRVDYVGMASSVPGLLALEGGRSPEQLEAALNEAGNHAGLSLIHVPVYFGTDPMGGMGVYGRWNVGNWVDDTQALRHEIGL